MDDSLSAMRRVFGSFLDCIGIYVYKDVIVIGGNVSKKLVVIC